MCHIVLYFNMEQCMSLATSLPARLNELIADSKTISIADKTQSADR